MAAGVQRQKCSAAPASRQLGQPSVQIKGQHCYPGQVWRGPPWRRAPGAAARPRRGSRVLRSGRADAYLAQ
eukprot:8871738-Alexandrium_andersonii.AAC.1